MVVYYDGFFLMTRPPGPDEDRFMLRLVELGVLKARSVPPEQEGVYPGPENR